MLVKNKPSSNKQSFFFKYPLHSIRVLNKIITIKSNADENIERPTTERLLYIISLATQNKQPGYWLKGILISSQRQHNVILLSGKISLISEIYSYF